MNSSYAAPAEANPAPGLPIGALFNLFVIGLTAFLTVVDLFATQAILPSLAAHYHVSPGMMGVAVNATTFGMAVAGLGAALFGRFVERRAAIIVCLALLALPTLLLAHAPNLAVFTALRVAQGVFMSAAFALTLAHLGERCSASASPAAFAAYVTGNVASNLFGRLIAASAVAHLGIAWNFYLFAMLNLAGAALVWATLSRAPPTPGHASAAGSPLSILRTHFANPALRIGFAIGFCILFAFVGTFTYVNFVLLRPPLSLGMAQIGLVYFVFAPSIVTTPLAGRVLARLGTRGALWTGLGVALFGLALLASTTLWIVLLGMALVASGTFLAQAIATGQVSRVATGDRGAASGIYLSCYFLGGLVGSYVLGQIFEHLGWAACLAGIGGALAIAAALASRLPGPPASTR